MEALQIPEPARDMMSLPGKFYDQLHVQVYVRSRVSGRMFHLELLTIFDEGRIVRVQSSNVGTFSLNGALQTGLSAIFLINASPGHENLEARRDWLAKLFREWIDYGSPYWRIQPKPIVVVDSLGEEMHPASWQHMRGYYMTQSLLEAARLEKLTAVNAPHKAIETLKNRFDRFIEVQEQLRRDIL